MVQTLEYASGNFPPRRSFLPPSKRPARTFQIRWLAIGTVLTYAGVFLTVAWSAHAIDRFQAADGGNVMSLYELPNHDYYEAWGMDVPGWVGADWILLIISLFTTLLVRRRTYAFIIVLFVLCNLFGIIVMMFMLDDVAMSHGLYT